ncbi:MAG: alcohol dehydrogenase catalytic domain-containing protein [Betaproteobacteria bacterium]|nr:alcohol dehydrogenase catalytic domain-containing protein [Betaproteobacteria bacterium]
MKAAVKYERRKGAVKIFDLEEPKIGPSEVLVRIKSAAVCGSDLHAYEFLPGYQTPEETKIPVTLGHEWSGIIADVGANVSRFRPGDRIMGESVLYCGECRLCLQGRTNICERFLLTGRHIDGAMAEYFKVDSKYLHRIPDGLSFEEAATAQPLSVSLHAVVDNCVIAPGDIVLVFGPGVIGLGAAQVARMLGASTVIVVGLERDEKARLPLAKDLGFFPLASGSDLAQELMRLTGRAKADVVIECSGDSRNIARGLGLVARGGRMTIVGISADPASVFYTPIVRNEIQIHTTFNGTWNNYDQALRLMAEKKINMKSLISQHELTEVVRVFDAALECEMVKPVLCP